MFTVSASLPYVMERLQELEMLDVLEKKYSAYQLWKLFCACDTDEEFNIVYQELV